jgi:hypothetical protein
MSSSFCFFASTPLSRVLEEIIPHQFEIFPKTLWNTKVQNCAHKEHVLLLKIHFNFFGAGIKCWGELQKTGI